MRIAVDLDGVCYEFQRTYRYMMRAHRLVAMPPVDEFWTEWDAQLKYGLQEDHDWMWTKGVDLGLFRYGHMVTGARRALEYLVTMGNELVIVTHRPARATPDTVDWLSLYMKGLPYELVILSNGEPKTTVKWDVLIDDKGSNIRTAAEAGRRGILFSRPWNTKAHWPWELIEYIDVAEGWEEVINVIRSIRASGGA